MKQKKIAAMITMPRLAFTDNMFCMMDSLKAYGIPVDRSFGIFWEHGITRLFEARMYDDIDYLLTIDYDTWFTVNHVVKLYQLMEKYPNMDAIAPFQVKRNEERLIYSVKEPGRTEEEVIPAKTAHFGLTMFRRESIQKLSKPWFLPVPNEFGEWGEGRVDSDVYFWKNFEKAGCELGLAVDVRVGHLQQMCSFPGDDRDINKPVMVGLQELADNKVPNWCVPEVTQEDLKEMLS